MNSSPQKVCLYSTDTSSFDRLKLVASQHFQLLLRPPTILFPKLAHLANQTSLWDCWHCASPPGNGILSSPALLPIFLPLTFIFICCNPRFYLQSFLHNPAHQELLCYNGPLSFSSHLPISPLCCDTDWRSNCVPGGSKIWVLQFCTQRRTMHALCGFLTSDCSA